MTRMTARVPTTPETHERLKEVRDQLDDVRTFDDTLRTLLDERED